MIIARNPADDCYVEFQHPDRLALIMRGVTRDKPAHAIIFPGEDKEPTFKLAGGSVTGEAAKRQARGIVFFVDEVLKYVAEQRALNPTNPIVGQDAE